MLNAIAGLIGNGGGAAGGDFESIQTVSVGAGGSTSISFTSIPSTYKHLQIRYIARDDNSGVTGTNKITFNSDTANNYWSTHFIFGNGSTATANAGSTYSSILQYRHAGNGSNANVFGAGIVDILDYTTTSKNKTVRSLAGFDNNGSGEIFFGSGLWFPSTIAAISSITITPADGTPKYLQYSTFALYGIKG